MNRRLPPNSRRPEGFILIMTLFVLAIVGMLLIALANHSMVTATDALSLRDEVERKWSQASCQRFALKNIDQFLTVPATEDQPAQLLRENGFAIQLQDSRFDIQIEDESAKLDVNFIFENLSEVRTASLIREMSPIDSGLIVRLRPNQARDAVNRRFEGWGQVFSYAPETLVWQSPALADATKSLTCWSPRLNVKTASDKTLLESAKLLVRANIAREIVDARKENEAASVKDLIAATSATAEQQQALTQYLADRSWCQSVSIRATHNGTQRTTQLYRKFYTSSIFRIQSYRW